LEPDVVKATIQRTPVLAYFIVAYLLSWSLWLPLVASVQGWWRLDIPAWWHYAGAAGPASAAFIVAGMSEGRAGVQRLLRQFSPARVRWPWLAFAVLSRLALLALGLGLARLADGEWPAYAELARDEKLPALGLPLTLLVHTVTFGVGEETGWRGLRPAEAAGATHRNAGHPPACGWLGPVAPTDLLRE
jgi:hypothetical protein